MLAWLVVELGSVEVPGGVRMACTAGTACFASTAAESSSKSATGVSSKRMNTSSAAVVVAVAD